MRRPAATKLPGLGRLKHKPSSHSGFAPTACFAAGSLPSEVFTNDEIYAFETDLAKLYPGNRHIKDKIRQQLQVLRDRGLLKQVRRGVWQRN